MGDSKPRAEPYREQYLTVQDVLKLPVPSADRRIPYGSGPHQFGDLRLPAGQGPFPVAIVIHGGCWLAEYDLDHIASLAASLARAGVATWSLECRRVGNPGGGWPGTLQDVGRGADSLRDLARRHSLNLGCVVAVGHSAGGQLALWLASRHRLPKESALYSAEPLRLRGIVALAGIPDLRRASSERVCGDCVNQALGGSPAEVPDRYHDASPSELLPLGVPQRLVHGARDRIVPIELARDFENAARKSGDDARLTVLPDAGHFELIAPQSSAWSHVKDAVLSLLTPGPA